MRVGRKGKMFEESEGEEDKTCERKGLCWHDNVERWRGGRVEQL